MGVLCLLLVILVFRTKVRLSKRSAYITQKKEELAPVVSSFLFIEEDADRGEKTEYLKMKVSIREQLKDANSRKVFAEMLLDLQRDITGEARERLYSLYTDLNLHEFAFEKLKSWRWEVLSQGIVELAQMQVTEAYSYIKPFINHRKGVVRKQAQLATVSLKPEGIQYFLDTARYGISEWQQMKLMDVLTQFKDFIPPRFSLWLTSGNPDVVLFALHLIRHYRQNEAGAALNTLLAHPDDKIKIATLECIREFCLVDALEPLKANFPQYRTEVKMAVLDVFSELGSEKDIEFLLTIKKQRVSYIVKSKALSTINRISPDTVLPQIAEITTRTLSDIGGKPNSPDPLPGAMIPVPDPGDRQGADEGDEWQSLLEEEEACPDISDLCCREEWESILLELTGAYQGELDLSFLPVIMEHEDKGRPEGGGEVKKEAEEILEMEVEAAVVDEEEKFRLELESILGRIHIFDKPASQPDSSVTGPEATEDDEITFVLDSEPRKQHSAQEAQDIIEDAGLDSPATPSAYRFSIFEELFRHCDAESKLILLDEILAVGGEKELLFLHTLETDESLEVRDKSVEIAKRLGEVLEKDAAVLQQAKEEEMPAANEGSSQTSAGIPPKQSLENCFLQTTASTAQPAEKSLWDIPFELEETSANITANPAGDELNTPAYPGASLLDRLNKIWGGIHG